MCVLPFYRRRLVLIYFSCYFRSNLPAKIVIFMKMQNFYNNLKACINEKCVKVCMLEKISTNKVQNSDYNGTIVCLCRFFYKNRIYPLSFPSVAWRP